MPYTTLSITKNNETRHYILSFADYLQEAWLSEIKAGDKVKVVQQFRCRKASDLTHIVESISGMGEITNLNAALTFREEVEQLQIKFEKDYFSEAMESMVATTQRLWQKFPIKLGLA